MSVSAYVGMDGNAWQTLCLQVLRVHEQGDLVTVPDQDHGDGGIEAFSGRGWAYQTYSPQGALSTSQRYEKHRDKMTTDVGKFINNGGVFTPLLGNVKICRWVLLVPVSDSKEIVKHAAAQAKRIKEAELPYVTDEPFVHVHTLEQDYEVAHRTVLSHKLAELAIPDVHDLDYSTVDTELVTRMRDKLLAIPRFGAKDELDRFVSYLLAQTVQGRAHRDYVRDFFPDLERRLAEEFQVLQNKIEFEVVASGDSELLQLAMTLASEVAAILNASPLKSQEVAHGQVAEWLMHCPLSFQQAATP